MPANSIKPQSRNSLGYGSIRIGLSTTTTSVIQPPELNELTLGRHELEMIIDHRPFFVVT